MIFVELYTSLYFMQLTKGFHSKKMFLFITVGNNNTVVGPWHWTTISVLAQDCIVVLGKKTIHTLPYIGKVFPGFPSEQYQYLYCLIQIFPTSEIGTLATSCFHSSFLQAMNVVIRWSFLAQRVHQASEGLCLSKL